MLNIAKNRFLTPAALLLLAGVGAVFAQDLASVFARIDKTAVTFRGFRADMKRVSHNHLIPIDDEDTGSIVVRRAKPHELQMLLNFNPPNEKRVAVEGSKIEIYTPKNNSIQAVLLGKESKGAVEAFMLLGFGSTSKELQSGYDVTYGGPETVSGEKTNRIELVPKSDEVKHQLQRVDLWISDASGLAIQQKFYFPGGDTQVVTFTNMKQASDIPASAVQLNAPKNARREKPLK